MAKNTIVMWGDGRNSEDTKRKLQKYDEYRTAPFDSEKRSKLYFDTVTFGYPIREIDPRTKQTRPEALNLFKATHNIWLAKSKNHTDDMGVMSANAYENDLNSMLKRNAINYRFFNTEHKYDRLYDYDPYVDFAILPTKERPSTFEQCVSFFYPFSNPNSLLGTQSPIKSTSPVAYDVMYDKGFDNTSSTLPEWKQKIKRPIDNLLNARQYGQGFYPNTHPDYHGSSVPIDLGEVTMMYAWFTMYKLLLCPNLYNTIQLSRPEALFNDSQNKQFRYGASNIVSTDILISEVRKKFNSYRKTLSVATAAAQSVASDPNFNMDSLTNALESQIDNLAKEVMSKGLTYFSKAIKDNLGVSSKVANILMGVTLGDTIQPRSLLTSDVSMDAITTEASAKLKSVSEDLKINLQQIPNSEQKFLKSVILFGSSIDSESSRAVQNRTSASLLRSLVSSVENTDVSKLSVGSKNLYNSILKSQAEGKERTKTFSYASMRSKLSSISKARSNPAVTLAIAAASSAFNTYMSSREKSLVQSLEKLKDYYSTGQSRLQLNLQEDGIEFVLDSDANLDGVKASETLGTKTGIQDREWEIKPYCGPVNGKFFKAYVIEIYRQLKPIIESVRAYFNVEGSMVGFDLVKKLVDASGNSLFVPEAIDMGVKNQSLNITDHCRTFTVFEQAKVPIKSTRWVLWDLPSFSPFTQAFGWEPTFLTNDPKLTDPNGIKEISGLRDILPHAYPNKEIGIFGSPYNKGKTFMAVMNGGWFSPGRDKTYSRVTSWDTSKWNTGPHYYWKTSSLQTSRNHRNQVGFGTSKGGKFIKTVNSQRKLSSATPNGLAGFTDLNFDVATGVPIFNAQWVAATSVIFCYGEALKNLADMGYGWAKKLYAEKPKLAPVDAKTFSAIQSIFGLSNKGAFSPSNLSTMSKALSSAKGGFHPLLIDPKKFSPIVTPKDSSKGSTETASDKGTLVPTFNKDVGKKPLTEEHDATKLALQLGISTISVGMLAILAIKLKRLK